MTTNLCRLCKGEVLPDGAHLHHDDQVTHNELLAHQEHLQERDYRMSTCGFCVELYDRARKNHREHAGDPASYHPPQDCIRAYRRYAERMSES